jgi:hypothetical protein
MSSFCGASGQTIEPHTYQCQSQGKCASNSRACALDDPRACDLDDPRACALDDPRACALDDPRACALAETTVTGRRRCEVGDRNVSAPLLYCEYSHRGSLSPWPRRKSFPPRACQQSFCHRRPNPLTIVSADIRSPSSASVATPLAFVCQCCNCTRLRLPVLQLHSPSSASVATALAFVCE